MLRLMRGMEAPRRGLLTSFPSLAWLSVLATVSGLAAGVMLSPAVTTSEASDRLPLVSSFNTGTNTPGLKGAFETDPLISLNGHADDFAVIMTIFPRAGNSELNFFYFDI